MSTSDLYILNKKSTTHLAEFQNGWGSAPFCWMQLSVKYLGKEFNLLNPTPTWKLAGQGRLQRFELIVLKMTFDRAYIPLANLSEAGAACIEFGTSTDITHKKMVNHWPAIGRTLQKASKRKYRPHVRGVSLSCTSVADCWGANVQDWIEGAWSYFEELPSTPPVEEAQHG